MLFITPTASARGAKDYFTRALAPSDYYLKDAAEAPGEWHGLGAELLGLAGPVRRQDFFRLCDNRDPGTGDPLTARTKSDRRVLYDFTFDAPKSVTLALELGGDERILDAFRASVSDTMAEIEAQMHARVRRNGSDADRRTGNLVWADFLHRTTRPVDGVPDPQLHCHAVAFNATFDPVEERWKAGQFAPLVRDKLYYQAAFHARLAERLTALGYEVHRDGTSFRLAGIDRSTVLKFSRRLSQIDAEASRLGVDDPRLRGELGRRTRDAKAGGASMSELRTAWRERLTERERADIAGARAKQAGGLPADEAGEAMRYAVQHAFERSSVLPERHLAAEALMHGVGRVSVDAVWRQARQGDVIRRRVDGQVLTTTRVVYEEEVAMLRFARDGRGQCRRLGGEHVSLHDAGLSDEQRSAALQVLSSRDRVIGLRGGAGTGKTRMMQATVKAIEAGGLKVFTFAPSARASRGVLRDEGFADADTVARLLTDPDVRRQVRGQVLWVDEAGLLSTKDMRRLFELAHDEKCRVVLSGDSAQHSSVGRGDALRLLETEAGLPFARLSRIRRQTVEQYREAVSEISRGDARSGDGRTMLQAGIDRLDRLGAIVEVAGGDRHYRLAMDYADLTGTTRTGRAKSALVVSPTHGEGERVAAAIRAELRRRGRLGSDERSFLSLKPLGLTEAERGSADSFHGGEVVRFHQNARGFRRGERVTVLSSNGRVVSVARADGQVAVLPLKEAAKFDVYAARELTLAAGDRLRITQNGFAEEQVRAGRQVRRRLNNGDLAEVAGFTKGGDIRLANGVVIPKDYGGIAQGYVVTSHASQGMTVDQVLIALGHESLSAANRQQFYVSVSRGREAVRLYTDDKAAMRDAVQTDASRLSATELLERKAVRPATRPAGTAGRLVALDRARSSRQAWQVRTLAAQSLTHHRQEETMNHGRR